MIGLYILIIFVDYIIIIIIYLFIYLRALHNSYGFRNGNEMTIYKKNSNNCGISSYALVPIIS
jgi:hypothetical protein